MKDNLYFNLKKKIEDRKKNTTPRVMNPQKQTFCNYLSLVHGTSYSLFDLIVLILISLYLFRDNRTFFTGTVGKTGFNLSNWHIIDAQELYIPSWLLFLDPMLLKLYDTCWFLKRSYNSFMVCSSSDFRLNVSSILNFHDLTLS